MSSSFVSGGGFLKRVRIFHSPPCNPIGIFLHFFDCVTTALLVLFSFAKMLVPFSNKSGGDVGVMLTTWPMNLDVMLTNKAPSSFC